ncbi:spore germination protein GerPC [Paenibacillus terrigena]|uniref:spore germination protein GerPC n=1 Tax=Paenibacillus terrigena TaxID=369333 RepID=UPI0003814CCD|nr:spore germination protein GerPC [Paenibacillus terrigena]
MNQASNNWSDYFRQLHTYINWQTDQINKLETNLEQLKKELTETRNQKQISIDKIEYRFDMLKVENLSGTLVIGVTPDGVKSMDEMEKNGLNWVQSSKDKQSDLYDSTSKMMDQYLKNQVPDTIDSFTKTHQVHVDQEYRQLMVSDLKKQVHDRIHHYINQMDKETAKDASIARQYILDHVKRDIQMAIEQHITTIQTDPKGAQHHANDSH